MSSLESSPAKTSVRSAARTSAAAAKSAQTQVRPAAEGWEQAKEPDGRPLLQFKSPRVSQPPAHLADMTLAERQEKVKSLGLPAFRAKQLSVHYFQHYTTDPAAMSDLPKERREELAREMFPPLLTEVKRLTTDNGDTIKFLWRLFDGSLVESVLMRYPGRITLCVSSQCGCGMNCPFCATGQANSRWKVDEALDAAYNYYRVTGRRVSIEYALIKDMNDHAWRADLLAKKLNSRGRGWVHVNPIPLNPTPGSIWTSPEPQVIREFINHLVDAGIPTTIRDTRGKEIDGACGQLAAAD